MRAPKNNLQIAFLILFIFFVMVGLVYYAETHHPEPQIKTFPDALWYSLVTITTVGYGDLVPQTPIGKLMSLFFLLGSLGLAGIFIGKLSEKINDLNNRRKMGFNGTTFTDHVVIIGWDSMARSVAKQLFNAGKKVAIVTNRKDDIDLIYKQFGNEQVFVLFSNLKNINQFKKLNIGNSSMTFVNLANDTDKLIAVLNLKKKHPKEKFLVTLDNSTLKETFLSAGVTYVLSRNEIASKMIASYIFEPDVAKFSNDLLSSAKDGDDNDFDIQQFKIMEENPFLQKTFGETFLELKHQYNIVLIGICKVKGKKRKLLKVPEDDTIIELGDYLIMILNGMNAKTISDLFKIEEGII